MRRTRHGAGGDARGEDHTTSPPARRAKKCNRPCINGFVKQPAADGGARTSHAEQPRTDPMARKMPSSADKDRSERVYAKLRAFGGWDVQIEIILKALGQLADRFPQQALAWFLGVYCGKALVEVAEALSEMTEVPVPEGTAAVWKTRAWDHLWEIIEDLLDPDGGPDGGKEAS